MLRLPRNSPRSSFVAAIAFAAAAIGCGGDGSESLPPPEDVSGPPADATTTGSGLAYRVLVEGTGESPSRSDRVTVHYTGWTTDGEMFDSSVVRGEPATFGVTQVIAGWTEGLQLMREGGTYRLWIPEDLAYGGAAGRPQGMLVFDVELIAVLR